MTLLAIRMLFSLPFFLFMAWLGNRDNGNANMPWQPPSRGDWGFVVLFGFIGYYLSSFLISGACIHQRWSERLILFTNPTIVVVLSALFLRKAHHRASHWPARLLRRAGAGVLARSGHHQRHPRAGDRHRAGVSSALCYAIYMMVGTGLTRRIGSTRFTAYMMLVATGFVMAQFFIMRPLSALDFAADDLSLRRRPGDLFHGCAGVDDGGSAQAHRRQ